MWFIIVFITAVSFILIKIIIIWEQSFLRTRLLLCHMLQTAALSSQASSNNTNSNSNSKWRLQQQRLRRRLMSDKTCNSRAAAAVAVVAAAVALAASTVVWWFRSEKDAFCLPKVRSTSWRGGSASLGTWTHLIAKILPATWI